MRASCACCHARCHPQLYPLPWLRHVCGRSLVVEACVCLPLRAANLRWWQPVCDDSLLLLLLQPLIHRMLVLMVHLVAACCDAVQCAVMGMVWVALADL